MKNTEKLIKWIVLLIVILILLIGTFISIISNIVAEKSEEEFWNKTEFVPKTEITRVTNKNKYYAVKNIAINYITILLEGNKEKAYNLLNPNYKERFGINEENVLDKLGMQEKEIEEDFKVTILDMYYVEESMQFTTYFLFGKVRNAKETQEIQLMVQIDSYNNAYYILPEEYMKKNGYENGKISGTYETDLEEIKANVDNKFNYINITTSELITEYIANYKDMLTYDLEKSYEYIDMEYREKKFGDYKNYEKYVKENKSKLLSIYITKYQEIKGEDYNLYICLDRKDNYYIFKETAIMQYGLIFDTYTIDLLPFVEKYETSDEQTKVAMQIEKIIQAINTQDYNYVYNKLAPTFRQNYFQTKEELEQYIKNAFFEQNKVEYVELETQEENYMYTIKIINAKNEIENMQKTFVVKLEEGTDFICSFQVE